MTSAYTGLHIRSTDRKGRCVAVSPAGAFVRSTDIERLVPWDEFVAIDVVNRRVQEERNECVAEIKTHSSLRAIEVDGIFSSETERASSIEAAEANLHSPSV